MFRVVVWGLIGTTVLSILLLIISESTVWLYVGAVAFIGALVVSVVVGNLYLKYPLGPGEG